MLLFMAKVRGDAFEMSVLLIKEDSGWWSAQCLEHDIVAQGKTLKEAESDDGGLAGVAEGVAVQVGVVRDRQVVGGVVGSQVGEQAVGGEGEEGGHEAAFADFDSQPPGGPGGAWGRPLR